MKISDLVIPENINMMAKSSFFFSLINLSIIFNSSFQIQLYLLLIINFIEKKHDYKETIHNRKRVYTKVYETKQKKKKKNLLRLYKYTVILYCIQSQKKETNAQTLPSWNPTLLDHKYNAPNEYQMVQCMVSFQVSWYLAHLHKFPLLKKSLTG